MTKFKTDNLNELMFRKTSHVLLSLYNNSGCSITQLFKETDFSYGYVPEVVKLLERKSVVTTKKKGRTRHITLTKKGERICELLTMLNLELKD